ncbi:MAG: terpene cyclase/mutase family protein, partial [Clostridiales bacterium]|nr:terpene cyclase/mutase family protein [Clostridiales bacterium]
MILALTAIGADPTDVAGYNLLTPLGDFDKTVWQGINGPVWALIALDSGEYPMPVNDQAKTQATRQMYLEEILSRQLDNGGWNLTDRGGNGQADPDVTGMVLQALSNYQSQAGVKGAVSRALTYLSQTQEADGGYASHSTSNSESVVQVIVALTSLGIDLEDARFVKNGNTLLDNLLGYRQADGSFLHTSAGTGESLMSCEQGLYGLVAAQRAAQGKSKLYEMDDVTIHVTGVDAPQTGLPGKNEDVQKCPVILPGATFVDIQGHTNQQAVE